MAKRKQAPDVQVVDVFNDDRAGLLKSLEGKDPGYVYSFQDALVTQDRLDVLSQEIVKNASGNIVKLGSDIVVKTPREVFEGARALDSERSFQTAKRIVADPRSIRQIAQAKTPIKSETETETGE